MVDKTLNCFCNIKKILLTPEDCLSCDFKEKQVFEDHISCINIRLAENLKHNVTLPLKKKKHEIREIIEKSPPTVLIVRKGGGMGDIVTTTVAIRGLRKKFPGSKLFYHCHEKYRDLLEGNRDLDGIITERTLKDDFDLVIELDNPCPCYVYEARNIGNPAGMTVPRVDLFCERAGVDPRNKLPFVKVNEKETEWVEDFFKRKKAKKLKIALAPVSFEMMKDWPIDKVKKLVPKLVKKLRATVFILHDKPLDIDNVIGFYGYSLRKVVALVNKMDLVISVDTGFIHLAGALQRPLIGLWGVNEPKRVMAHYKKTSWIWKKDKFPCTPCYYLHTCMKFPSPCMEAITPEEVFNEAKKRLSNPRS